MYKNATNQVSFPSFLLLSPPPHLQSTSNPPPIHLQSSPLFYATFSISPPPSHLLHLIPSISPPISHPPTSHRYLSPPNQWALIRDKFPFEHQRTNVDLKDKWRNMEKAGTA